MKLVRRVGGDVDRLSRMNGRFAAPEGGLDFSFEHDEGLFEVVPMRPRTAAWRHVHIDGAELAVGVVSHQR